VEEKKKKKKKKKKITNVAFNFVVIFRFSNVTTTRIALNFYKRQKKKTVPPKVSWK